ncbi:hypothetical protein [Burkholderia cepacia]|uniref:hypothetical protein n=1 Tax=Burkholderia cepacia TaxID=292 RepID=UPI0009BE012B|nr:hypothetical protein [Burkholderia cepacia]
MKSSYRGGPHIAWACALAACTLAACSQDYRNSTPAPTFNQRLTDWFSKATLSPQVTRIDCFVDTGWFDDSLACDVEMTEEQSRKVDAKFVVRSNLSSFGMTPGPDWQFDAETLHESKFRLVIAQPAPAVLRVEVHADQSRVSFEDAAHLGEKAISAVDEFLRAHPTRDPQSVRETWASPASQASVAQSATGATASATSTAGGRQ